MVNLINKLDSNVFRYINEYVKQNTFLDYLMIFFAEYAQYMFILLFMILWLNKKYKNRTCVIQAIIACCLAFLLNRIIGLFFYRERPFVSHLNINQLVEHTANASFPSDHATSAFTIAITLYLYERRLGKVFLLLAIFISFSRIWVGVHYPLDVLLGAVLGTLWAFIAYYIIKTIFKKNK
ncbi:undecaprenyl-diphosphatase [Bacillus thuringiensis]|uniref:Undecaprenyl-diphosphatase n=1 Tax=Bacillus thuringiensis TaxID=1428 RepID=A0A9W3XI92_BACTU|nr:undecaprenyl-diphosphatase [Bacillus thuringiensis]AQY38398.1 undecaprenyl-diphosphatase [Bacillus thuringiensis]MDR4150724.1 undecaprenyl-diphosphatase [Bacillus thuringiensis]MEC3572224.1 undecaprenyl-diphosphatase [Bacillus thuringiensis]MED2017924.1 undecaprenyl-diphosphatase [Bacillus thuringiensis]MED2145634.1 undecaprenyl-diphosphatase [Bacillus thuringiensis]